MSVFAHMFLYGNVKIGGGGKEFIITNILWTGILSNRENDFIKVTISSTKVKGHFILVCYRYIVLFHIDSYCYGIIYPAFYL